MTAPPPTFYIPMPDDDRNYFETFISRTNPEDMIPADDYMYLRDKLCLCLVEVCALEAAQKEIAELKERLRSYEHECETIQEMKIKLAVASEDGKDIATERFEAGRKYERNKQGFSDLLLEVINSPDDIIKHHEKASDWLSRVTKALGHAD